MLLKRVDFAVRSFLWQGYIVSIIEAGLRKISLCMSASETAVKMSKKEDIEARAEALVKPITDAAGLTIYDVDYVKEAGTYYLRVYIDKPGGVTIDDCENVSRAFNTKLDEEDFIEEAYIMEISSPGLGRRLTKDRHLENSLGEEVEIRLYKPLNKEKEFIGKLASYNKEEITITGENDEVLVFKRSDISLIRLTFDF